MRDGMSVNVLNEHVNELRLRFDHERRRRSRAETRLPPRDM